MQRRRDGGGMSQRPGGASLAAGGAPGKQRTFLLIAATAATTAAVMASVFVWAYLRQTSLRSPSSSDSEGEEIEVRRSHRCVPTVQSSMPVSFLSTTPQRNSRTLRGFAMREGCCWRLCPWRSWPTMGHSAASAIRAWLLAGGGGHCHRRGTALSKSGDSG